MDGVKTRYAVHEYRPIDVDELTEAEKEVIRHMQRKSFKEETRKLKKITKDNETHREDDSRSRIQKPKGTSPLSRLDQFLDHSNLARIGR